jgi:hypothetical protein
MSRLTPARRGNPESPQLLINFLRYALDDVRALSERSGRHLEEAISMLTEDTSVIDIGRANGDLRQQS